MLTVFQISLVFHEQVRAKFAKQYIATFHKTAETFERGCIGFRGPYLSQTFQPYYLLPDIVVKRRFLSAVMETYDDIIRCKRTGLA